MRVEELDMIIMSLELENVRRQQKFRRRLNLYWTLSVIACAITASALSFFGFIIYDTITSFIMGGGFGIVYVIFEDKYWGHVRSHVFRNYELVASFEKQKEGGE